MTNEEFFNVLDYVYIAWMFVSCASGFIRGFTKDFFSTCAWFGSGFIATAGAPYLIPITSRYIQNITLARCTTILVLYFSVLTVLLLVINLASDQVKSGPLSMIDRAVGALFGFVRGVGILISFCILLLIFEVSPKKHDFVKNSKISSFLFPVAKLCMPRVNRLSIVKKIKPIITRKNKKTSKNGISTDSSKETLSIPKIKKQESPKKRPDFLG